MKIMVQAATLRRRSWAGMVWLLVVSIGLVIALALGNTLLLVGALAAALLSGWLLLRRQAPAQVSSPPPAIGTGSVPRTLRGVWSADGTLLQAQVLPVEAVEGYQTVLTINGYALVNAEGRIVYPLSRGSHADASEPVVVTIFDEQVDFFEEEVAAR
jgi:hypothetical protein